MKKQLFLLTTGIAALKLHSGKKTTKVISTSKAPKAIGPYNQAIIHGKTIYCSGQIAIDPKTNTFVGGDIVTQTKRVFENIKGLLAACGSDFNNVIKCNVYLKDINDFSTVNEIYADYFKGCDYPARSAVEVSHLPKDALIEIEVIATK